MNDFRIVFSDSTIYLVETKSGITKPLKETTGLSINHVPVWTVKDFFAVSPDLSKQTVTWGKLKKP